MYFFQLFLHLCTIALSAVLGADHNAGAKSVHLIHLTPRQVFDYKAYKDVQIFHYHLPEQVQVATWNFSAAQVSVDCSPRNVSVYLKYGSYPVVSPDGAVFPENYLIEQSPINEVHFLSNGSTVALNVTSPIPGDWYAVAFLKTISGKIIQKGLYPNCSTWLESEVKATVTTDVIVVFPEVQAYQDILLFQEIANFTKQTYKFFVPADIWAVQVNISRCVAHGTNVSCPIIVTASGRSLPDLSHPSTIVTNCTGRSSSCQQEWLPWENQWHYLTVSASHHRVAFSLKVLFKSCAPEYPLPRYLLVNDLDMHNICSSINKTSKLRVIFRAVSGQSKSGPLPSCYERLPLTRKTYPGSFLFEYDQVPYENGSIPLKAQISSRVHTLMSFEIFSVQDIGGTLQFDLRLDSSSANVSLTRQNTSVTACLSHGVRAEVFPGKCSVGVPLLVNTTTAISSRISVPYPEPGLWYISFKVHCFVQDPSSESGVTYKDCVNNSTRIFFGLGSSPCVFGGCGRYGRCHQYISSGFIFSTCICSAGYRGWGCTDDTKALSSSELLLGTLLLTLSNLLFIPPIMVALRRKFYTEAFLYACTMFFSTFYHACDEEGYSFCLMRLSVMQFCDFYSAILSFWVTLVAMSHLGNTMTSLAHMAGAVGVALGIEYDQTGLWVFVVPVLSGVFILTISWTAHMRRKRGCFPSKKYWFLCLPLGVLLAAGGLLSYAFFETEDNYKFVHSLWHVVMAISIVFLLPLKKDKNLVVLQRGPSPIGDNQADPLVPMSVQPFEDSPPRLMPIQS